MPSAHRIVRVARLVALLTAISASALAGPSIGRIPFVGTRSPQRPTPTEREGAPTPEKQPRGIALSIANLRTRPFVNRASYVPKEVHAANAALDRKDYGPDMHPSPGRYQSRARRLFRQIQAKTKSELGVEGDEPSPQSIEVIEGGAAESPEAVALPDGSVLVHRQLIDTADRAGEIMAASKSDADLVGGLLALAKGRAPRPSGIDRNAANRYADGFLAFAVAHEATHVFRAHFERPLGRDGQPIDSPAVDHWRVGKERTADAGGLELATRAGHSPAGQAVTLLYISILGQVANMDAKHPPGFDRYATAYRTLQARTTGHRVNYRNGVRSEGEPWMTEADAADLARLPKPEDVAALVNKAMTAARTSRGAKSP